MKIAYTFAEAAEATGYGLTVIKVAVRHNDILPSYANSKPVIHRDELDRWVKSLPSEPPAV